MAMGFKKFIASYLVFAVFSRYFPPIPGKSQYPLKKRSEKGHGEFHRLFCNKPVGPLILQKRDLWTTGIIT
jgi:hypothetical protein